MPTYVYRREDGTTFELVQRMSEEPLTVDPETGQRVQRVISGAGLIFKGSGFYLTDYVRKGDKGGDADSKGSESKASESSEGKKETTTSESKSEAKTETKAAPKKESASAKADA